MPKIKQLTPHEAQKIAAGEVVERPANIVKELVENSIDAGATTISVYIKDSGKQLIRVVDDGCGMDQTDARLCFEKHATSKISSVDDLEKINTFGFRGEALATITAVARVTLITKELDAQEGIQIIVEQNNIIHKQPIPANTGTDISVHDLFYNIPARKKFLKARETEWRHITQLMHAFCLAYPSIHFKLFSEGKEFFNFAANDDLTQRCAQIWQQADTISINGQRENYSVSVQGAVSSQQQYRYDRNGIFLFVNKRWIKDYKLSNALIKGYQNVLPPGRFPYACIAITIDPALIDVNIHPRKEEVRFMNPQIVEKLIQSTVKQTLEAQLSSFIHSKAPANQAIDNAFAPLFTQSPSPVFTPYDFEAHTQNADANTRSEFAINKSTNLTRNTYYGPNSDDIPPINTKNHTNIQQPFVAPYAPASNENIEHIPTMQAPDYTPALDGNTTHTSAAQTSQHMLQNMPIAHNVQQNTHDNYQGPHNTHQQNEFNSSWPVPVQQHSIGIDAKNHLKIIGQFNKTYILIEKEEGLFLVDQHAAHERILYETFSQKFQQVATVNLLFPHIITLTPQDFATIENHLQIFTDNGIVLEPFGNNQLIVQSTPVHFKNQSCQELIKQTVGWINECANIEHELFLKKIHEKVHAQMACKAAVKAGDVLTTEQMTQILTDLNTSANRFTCPHGRPTGWLLSLHEIEKKFKRKL